MTMHVAPPNQDGASRPFVSDSELARFSLRTDAEQAAAQYALQRFDAVHPDLATDHRVAAENQIQLAGLQAERQTFMTQRARAANSRGVRSRDAFASPSPFSRTMVAATGIVVLMEVGLNVYFAGGYLASSDLINAFAGNLPAAMLFTTIFATACVGALVTAGQFVGDDVQRRIGLVTGLTGLAIMLVAFTPLFAWHANPAVAQVAAGSDASIGAGALAAAGGITRLGAFALVLTHLLAAILITSGALIALRSYAETHRVVVVRRDEKRTDLTDQIDSEHARVLATTALVGAAAERISARAALRGAIQEDALARLAHIRRRLDAAAEVARLDAIVAIAGADTQPIPAPAPVQADAL